MGPKRGRLGYVRGLDGIRGLAVLAVLLFHGGVSWAKGGFLGVDVFFVLSGFLITTLLLQELDEDGTVDLRTFWARRARRLLPALVVVVLVVTLLARLVAQDRSVLEVHKDAAGALAYVANWRFVAAGSSYFEATGSPSPLKHTWSLAVEEQFYLLWPLIVLFVARRRRLWLTLAAFAGAVGSAVAMAVVYRSGHDPSRAYYGTDTHAQVLMIGALLALLLSSQGLFPRAAAYWTSRNRKALALSGMAGAVGVGIALAAVTGGSTWLYRGGFTVVSLATAVLIGAVVLDPTGLVSRLLSWEPIAALGRVSYGVYLWHWPLFLFLTCARTGLAGVALLAVRVGASVTAAVLSAWLIERPIRNGRLLSGWRAGVLLPAVASAAAIILFATTLLASPSRPAPTVALGQAEASSSAAPTTTAAPALRPTRAPKAEGASLRLLVVGDSVALTLGVALDQQMKRAGIDMRNRAVLGCGIVRQGPYRYFGNQSDNRPECQNWPAQWSNAVKNDDPDLVMVVVGRWEVMDRVHEGRWVNVFDPSYDAYLASELELALKVLTEKGARVALCTTPYFYKGERPDGGRWPEDDPSRVDRFNEVLRSVASHHKDQASVVELGKRTSTGGRYTRSLEGVELRYDGVHFTPQAGRWLAPWLLPQLTALVSPSSSVAAELSASGQPQGR